MRASLDADLLRLREAGYDASWLLTDSGETALSVVGARLAAEKFDCILVGAGIRTIVPLFLLFEKLVNAIHAGASGGQDRLQHQSRRPPRPWRAGCSRSSRQSRRWRPSGRASRGVRTACSSAPGISQNTFGMSTGGPLPEFVS